MGYKTGGSAGGGGGGGSVLTSSPISGDGTLGNPVTVAAGAITNASLAGDTVFKLTSVKLVTTGDDTLSGLAARDGAVPVAGDRILAWQQTNPTQNGIYLAAAGAWTRASDWNSASTALPGSIVVVTAGNSCSTASAGGAMFQCTTKSAITPGVTSVAFQRIPAGQFWAEGAAVSNIGANILQAVVSSVAYRLLGISSSGSNEYVFGDKLHGNTKVEGATNVDLTDDNSLANPTFRAADGQSIGYATDAAARIPFWSAKQLADPTEYTLGLYDNLGTSHPFGGLFRGADSGQDNVAGGVLQFRSGRGRGSGSHAYSEFGGSIQAASGHALQAPGFSARAYGQWFAATAGLATQRTPVSDADYNALVTNHQIAYTAITAPRVVNGPSTTSIPSGIALEFILTDESGSAGATNTITFTPNSGTIDGLASKALVSAPYGSARVYFDGANWHSATNQTIRNGTFLGTIAGTPTYSGSPIFGAGFSVATGQNISGAAELSFDVAAANSFFWKVNNVTIWRGYPSGGLALDGGNDPGSGSIAIGNNTFVQGRSTPVGTLRILVGLVSGVPQVGDQSLACKIRGLPVQVLDGFSFHRRAVADVDATIAFSDCVVMYSSISAARVATLQNPAAGVATAAQPQIWCVGDESGSCSAINTITLTPGGAAVWKAPTAYIVGGNIVLSTPYAKVWFYSDGTNFHLMNVPLV